MLSYAPARHMCMSSEEEARADTFNKKQRIPVDLSSVLLLLMATLTS